MRFTFIEAHRVEFAVVTMCRVLRVSKAGYYAWRTRPQSARAVENEQLVLAIRAVHAESDRTYGSPRMQPELVALGHPCSENRVAWNCASAQWRFSGVASGSCVLLWNSNLLTGVSGSPAASLVRAARAQVICQDGTGGRTGEGRNHESLASGDGRLAVGDMA